ncbi:AAA family ATPase [Streptomyces sp. NBC_01317]|uniref:helix-turn-helix transcriptional regulator n=1 Tax=Streptomyces sp. NBC_01317 TaxID=2903822 RepID=UPI002E128860|nr:AAA family ATPase [Streptomyces sp. NBC_01317]
MKLSERDEELQLLNQLYGGCVRGKGSVVLTNGPVGCGKTALLQTFAEHVEERGGRFLSVTASATEKLHLFGLIDQLGNAMRTGGTTADLFAAEDGVTVSADAESQGAPQVPLGLLQRISRAVADSAEDRPLVLGIDDVHFADEPSLQCLRYLIRRIDSSAVMIVMNESSCHERELATLHAETLHLPYCHRIRIAPLTVAGVTDQLADRLGAAPERGAAEAWADASGGNPLLLHALVDDHLLEDDAARTAVPGEAVPGPVLGQYVPGRYVQGESRSALSGPEHSGPGHSGPGHAGPGNSEPPEPGPPEAEPREPASEEPPQIAPVAGASFRHAFLRCLHRCELSMLDAARAVAVLGESASPSLVGDFLDADATSARRALADLNAAGLLSGVRFRHEQAPPAVLDDIPARDLHAMHNRAAELLHESGAPALAVAAQLMATHGTVKAAWRVDILREAARDAMESGDIAQSVDFLRHASGICADGAQVARVTAELAEAQWLIDPTKAARHTHQLGYLVRTGLLTGDGAMVPVKQLIWRGDFAEADALLRTIEASQDRDRAGPSRGPLPSDVTLVRLWLSFCYPNLSREAATADMDGTYHPLVHPAIGSGPVSALTFLNLLGSLSGEGEGNADGTYETDRLLRGTHAGSPMAARLFALIFLIQTHRVDEAVHWSERLLQEPWIRRVPMRRALMETIRTVAALRQGDLVTAGRSVRTALEVASPSAWGVMAGLPLALAVHVATELGQFDVVLSYLNLPVPPVMFDTPFALPYLRAFGRYHLATGRPHTALTNFQLCGELMAKWRLDWSELADWRNDAASALIAMGQLGGARALIEEQLSRQSEGHSRARGIALRLLAATSPLNERLPLLLEAVEILAACGDQPELRRAQGDLTFTRTALQRPGTAAGREAFAVLSRALPGYEEGRPGPRGHAWPHRDTRGEHGLAEESGSDPLLAELTDAERRVGALAALGCTNREIAGKLFITVSTVEQHLTKIYRKLKVSSRSDLPQRLVLFADIRCTPDGRRKTKDTDTTPR